MLQASCNTAAIVQLMNSIRVAFVIVVQGKESEFSLSWVGQLSCSDWERNKNFDSYSNCLTAEQQLYESFLANRSLERILVS